MLRALSRYVLLEVLSKDQPTPYDYFKQIFEIVTPTLYKSTDRSQYVGTDMIYKDTIIKDTIGL